MDPRARARLGRSTVHVDQLLLGLVPLGNLYKVVPEDEAQAVLQAWWDRGLRTYDVAPVYGFGLAERRLGRFLADKPRSEFVVSTKVGRPVREGAPDDPELYWPDGTPYFHGMPEDIRPYYDYTRDGMLWGLERSLERLGLDRVDYVHMHDPDDHIQEAIQVVFPALAELREQGVIGAIGVGTNWGRVAYPIARQCDLDCVLLAGRYTLIDFEGTEALLPLCEERGISVINGGLFNGGFLADPRIGGTFQYRPTACPSRPLPCSSPWGTPLSRPSWWAPARSPTRPRSWTCSRWTSPMRCGSSSSRLGCCLTAHPCRRPPTVKALPLRHPARLTLASAEPCDSGSSS